MKVNFSEDFEIFNNENLGSVRTAIDDAGQIWFVAKDVCDVLEIENNRTALLRLDENEKTDVVFLDVNKNGVKQNRRMNIINESGMYTLVLTSRKPQAKDFKRWLTTEVIPSIRKNGGYIYNQELLKEKENKELSNMVDALSLIVEKKVIKNADLTKSVTKYKKRWHELVSEKNELKDINKKQKKNIKALNEYAANQEDMYESLYKDFVKLYEENKSLKLEKEDFLNENNNVVLNNDISQKEAKNKVNDFNEPIYFINKEGMLVSNDLFQDTKDNVDYYER